MENIISKICASCYRLPGLPGFSTTPIRICKNIFSKYVFIKYYFQHTAWISLQPGKPGKRYQADYFMCNYFRQNITSLFSCVNMLTMYPCFSRVIVGFEHIVNNFCQTTRQIPTKVVYRKMTQNGV